MSLPNAIETLSIKLRQERITITSKSTAKFVKTKTEFAPVKTTYLMFLCTNKMAASRRLTPFFFCDLELRRSHKLQYDFYMLIQSS